MTWKKINKKIYKIDLNNREFQITKSGSVWAITEQIGHCMCYLTNANSLPAAKKIVSNYNKGKIYFDDNCIPRTVINENR